MLSNELMVIYNLDVTGCQVIPYLSPIQASVCPVWKRSAANLLPLRV